MTRVFALQFTEISPRVTASTVKKRSSDTRMPVPQIACITSQSCSCLSAACKSR